MLQWGERQGHWMKRALILPHAGSQNAGLDRMQATASRGILKVEAKGMAMSYISETDMGENFAC